MRGGQEEEPYMVQTHNGHPHQYGLSMLRLMLIWQNLSSKASTKLGVLGMSVVDIII